MKTRRRLCARALIRDVLLCGGVFFFGLEQISAMNCSVALMEPLILHDAMIGGAIDEGMMDVDGFLFNIETPPCERGDGTFARSVCVFERSIPKLGEIVLLLQPNLVQPPWCWLQSIGYYLLLKMPLLNGSELNTGIRFRFLGLVVLRRGGVFRGTRKVSMHGHPSLLDVMYTAKMGAPTKHPF